MGTIIRLWDYFVIKIYLGWTSTAKPKPLTIRNPRAHWLNVRTNWQG